MHTVYQLNANELNSQFLESLKTLFKDKDVEIEIIVSEVDETAYLLQDDKQDSIKTSQGATSNLPLGFEQQLALMANDPAIQSELRTINQEFAITEADGLKIS